jgi:hypothetical protein
VLGLFSRYTHQYFSFTRPSEFGCFLPNISSNGRIGDAILNGISMRLESRGVPISSFRPRSSG